jgi:DNA-binding beta-propeller fold protein YncE
MGARVNGIHEVTGSIPVWSTNLRFWIHAKVAAGPFPGKPTICCSQYTRRRRSCTEPRRIHTVKPLATAAFVVCLVFGAYAQSAPDYLVYVASEAADRLTLLRFDGSTLRVESEFETGIMPVEIDGPHGLGVSPDGQSFFVSLAHGLPNGTLLKYSTSTHRAIGRATLGMFPATLQVSPSGEFVYVANFNLHGDPVPSSVSVVHADTMLELARIETCRMPHGSRFNALGTRHYSACMMDDMVVEIDTATFRVSRHFRLAPGAEGGDVGPPPMAHGADHDMTAHGADSVNATALSCSPTWVQPAADAASIFVACNGTSQIVEIEVDTWRIRRRLAARNGVYNLATTRNGRLLVTTNRRDQSASIIDLQTGLETAHVATPRKAVHGVVITRDDRYAFVSSEGIGAEPGSVVAIDLERLAVVAAADVAPQAGGIDIR